LRAHRRCRRHHGGEAWGGLDVDITRTVSLTRVSRVPQSTAEKRGSSVTRSHHASREFCHAMLPHQSRYFLTRLWAVHSSHTRVLKWFFLGFQHPKPVRRGTSGRAPIRRSYASLLVSDARIFPRHAHTRGRRRLPRVPRAPTPSTNRAHSQVRDPPVGCGMRRARGRARLLRRRAGSRGATQRKLRDTRGHRRRLPRGCVHVHEIQPALTTIAPTTPPKQSMRVKPPTLGQRSKR
jgi:hypothetical protein